MTAKTEDVINKSIDVNFSRYYMLNHTSQLGSLLLMLLFII